MKSKLLFFDVDGTLVAFDGRIPESTISALKEAQANGHKTFICTGRSRNQIPGLLLDMAFDGIVGATGGYGEYRGETIFHNIFGRENVSAVVDLIRGNGTAVILQRRDDVVTTDFFVRQFNEDNPVFARAGSMTHVDTFKYMKIDNDLELWPERYPDTESLIYCRCPYVIEEVRSRLPLEIRVAPACYKSPEPHAGEFTLERSNKGTGIRTMLDHLGCSREDVIAFGDGANDLEMLDLAGTAVVMGNAPEAVKAHGDLITESLEKDGLAKAMQRLGLIG